MRFFRISTTASAVLLTALTMGITPVAQAAADNAYKWRHVGSFYTKTECEKTWTAKYARKWADHQCVRSPFYFESWSLFVR